MTPMQNSRDTAPYPREEILTLNQVGKGWNSLIVDSCLAATSGSSGDVIVTRRGKSRGGRQKFKVNSTQTPYGNKTSVSVDKENQMTPQKANTSLRETVSEEYARYDKARLYPPVPGMTEEDMLRSGPVCKDCHKEHYGQVCPHNECGWIHPHHGCLDRPFTPEEIPTITEVPQEDSKTKEIKLTVPIKGKCWCWLCKPHGPEEVCPRKDEISTEYGRQRLKELLQEMVKAEERVDQGEEKNGEVPKENQETWFLGTQPSIITKGEPMGPKPIQPPEGKKSHIKPYEMGGGAQWATKPTTSTPSKDTSSTGGQPPRKSTQGTFNVRGSRDRQGEEQPPPRLPPKENGRGGGNGNGGDDGDDDDDDDDVDEYDEDTQSLRVKMVKIQMHLEDQEEEVMDHHPTQELEMWDQEVEGDIEVKEDGQVHRVYQVYKDHRDLRALRV